MRHAILIPLVMLAGCASPSLQGSSGGSEAAEAPVQVAAPAVAAPPPPPNARTIDQFDTTTQEQRAAAVAVAEPAGAQPLGTTIATLGPPTEPGIWLKTALVSTTTQGRVEYQGKSINLELRPSGGAAGSGSQISLAAMRLIGAPLTSLPELTVFAR